MSDEFTFNNKHSVERMAIENFLSIAQQRVGDIPEVLPMKAQAAHLTINWLRGLLDKRPSQFTADLIAAEDRRTQGKRVRLGDITDAEIRRSMKGE